MAINTLSGPDTVTGQARIYGATIPPEGPRACGFKLDFVDYTENVIDFTYAYENKQMTVVQSIWVDNSVNPEEVTITARNSPFQAVKVQPFTQGTYPLISAIRPVFSITTDGSCYVNVIFCNIPLPSSDWQIPDGSGAPAAAEATEVDTANTPVTVFAGVLPNGGRVINPFGAALSLFLDYVNPATDTAPGANGTTFELVPGQAENVPAGVNVTLTANSADSAHFFTAFAL